MADAETDRELTSWKAIGDYLGVNARTAQKWESVRGLPVHRLRGKKGRVFAIPAELNSWKANSAQPVLWWNNPAALRYCAAAALAIALVVTGFSVTEHLALNARGHPASFRLGLSTLVVLDATGKELWEHSFEAPFATDAYAGYEGQHRVWLGDIDGDSKVETLFTFHPSRGQTAPTRLLCFSESGKLKWKFEPGRAVRDATGASYPPPYVLAGFAVVDFGKQFGRRIAVTSRNLVYYPNQFVLLDARGSVLGEYWHSGHLDYMEFIDLDGDGVKEILLTGVNNAYKQATLVVLDPCNFTGASFQGAENPYQLQGFPTHKEKAVLLFPRTCINRKFEMYNMARDITKLDDSIRVTVYERDREDLVVIYILERDLRLKEALVSDSFRATHRRLEGEGALDHPLTAREVLELRNVTVLANHLRSTAAW